MSEHKHTAGEWRVGGKDKTIVYAGDGYAVASCAVYHGRFKDGEAEANARLIAAAPELLDLAESFEIRGPDDDGLLWLVLHGAGTTGKAMFNLGDKSNSVAFQVAQLFEQDRRAAIAKATGATHE